jgi:hypothetical protein
LRIARVQIEEWATPVLALAVDGAYYDVAVLEAEWGLSGLFGPSDFHGRVVSARCAGLDQLEIRLLSGQRPTEARLMVGDFLPLPPCEPDRAAYIQMAPYDAGGSEPRFQQRDSRSLMGHDQPISMPHAADAPSFEAGLALLLGDDLWRADAREAARAVLGYSLLIDWTQRPARWDEPWAADAPSQMGPELLVGPRARDLAKRELCITVDGQSQAVGRIGAWRFSPAESLAYLSQHQPLRSGDVIGVGCFAGGRPQAPLSYGARVEVSVAKSLSLRGWAAPGPAPLDWKQR